MSEDRKRTYESTTSLPTLRPKIGVPPLQMVLLDRDGEDAASKNANPNKNKGAEGPASKERVVRKIIAHLEKDS